MKALDIIHHPRCGELYSAVQAVALPVLRARRNCHWISTPDGDFGGEWCGDCGAYKVRNLRRHDRKRRDSYSLDGGWRTDDDHSCFCQGCGSYLNTSLTTYGALAEVEAFVDYGVTPGNAQEAAYLTEVLNTLEWTDPQHAFAAETAADMAEALLWSAT